MRPHSTFDSRLHQLRHDHAMLSSALAQIKRDHYARKYDPDQPRVPAGSPNGGQWGGGGGEQVTVVARRIIASLEKECLARYESDLLQCRIIGSKSCYRQAMVRYGACLARQPIPPFNY